MYRKLNAFFIVGAPRAGTTAMCRYLGKHPDVCFSNPKETHFFLSADRQGGPEETRKRFMGAFFPDLTEHSLILGEGSVSTLYSEDAIRRILEAFPAAKFIVLLRDPVELLRSYHARLVYLCQEDEEDFETAWDLQEVRARGESIPAGCRDPRILQYREVGRLGHYCKQLIDLTGRENCKIIFFEDFLSDTLSVYKDTLEFLGLEYDGRISFTKKNPRQVYKSRFLQHLYSGFFLRPLARKHLQNPERLARIQRFLRPLRKRIKKINSIDVDLPPLDPAFVQRLRDEFREDIELLARTFERDLHAWMDEEPEKELRAAAG